MLCSGLGSPILTDREEDSSAAKCSQPQSMRMSSPFFARTAWVTAPILAALSLDNFAGPPSAGSLLLFVVNSALAPNQTVTSCRLPSVAFASYVTYVTG